MVFSRSDFIGGCEEFARFHGRQALGAGRIGRGPARAEEAGFGDLGDGDGVGLVAAQQEEMRVVLAERSSYLTSALSALAINETDVNQTLGF